MIPETNVFFLISKTSGDSFAWKGEATPGPPSQVKETTIDHYVVDHENIANHLERLADG